MTSEYERGLAEGRIDGKLESHERRLDGINGSIEKTSHQLSVLSLQLTEMAVMMKDIQNQTKESVAARVKYVPMIENMERTRIAGLKRWHVAAGAIALVLPQTINLILRLAGLQ